MAPERIHVPASALVRLMTAPGPSPILPAKILAPLLPPRDRVCAGAVLTIRSVLTVSAPAPLPRIWWPLAGLAVADASSNCRLLRTRFVPPVYSKTDPLPCVTELALKMIRPFAIALSARLAKVAR